MFSLIIPCHNPDKTIARLFDSLTRQNISKDLLEIIVVDDNSDSLEYRKVIDRYGFNVKYCETNETLHCPGNTRREGMKYVTQEWLCFCDQDDFFEDDAFAIVKHYIDIITSTKHHTIYVVSTIMRTYNEEKNVRYKDFVHKQAWLHGKFYSMNNLIKPYNINFKHDLKTHEDIYFNALVLAYLYKINKDWDYLNEYTYCWVDNPDSITRRETQDRGYLFENFHDYLVCAGEPYWEDAKDENNIVCRNQVIMTLLHAYFYYEFASYYFGSDAYKDIIKMLYDYIHAMIDELGMTPEYIVDFVYNDPYKYEEVAKDCKLYCEAFIPKTSFRDFVFRLAK